MDTLIELKQSGKYLTTQEALAVFKDMGVPMCVVTLHRIAREQDMLFQPRGKRGECFIEREKLIAFLKLENAA